MKQLSPQDKITAAAILQTHAEMQDMRATQSMEVLARIKRDQPEESEMIDCLEEQIKDLEDDSINLRRIAGSI